MKNAHLAEVKIAHLSDSHFDERGRLDDVVEIHRAFLDQAREAGVDLIVHAGDWFERRSTPAERNAVADFLEAARNVAPLFGVKGNHDQAGDLDIMPRLEAGYCCKIVSRPGVYAMPTDGGYIQCVGIPWFDKAHMAVALGAEDGPSASSRLTIEAAKAMLMSLRAEVAGRPAVVVGHLMVHGSEVSSGQTIMGQGVELTPWDLSEMGAGYVALGHVHKTQEWFGGRVAYSGSPHRCNYGEPEAKGWRLVTVTNDGEFVSNEFRELPARRMVLLEVDWRKGGLDEGLRVSKDEVRDALVRFRYRIDAPNLPKVHAERIRQQLLDLGAYEANVEAVVESQARARAPEIVTQNTLWEKVQTYLRAKGIAPDAARDERLRAKVGQLESEVGSAD